MLHWYTHVNIHLYQISVTFHKPIHGCIYQMPVTWRWLLYSNIFLAVAGFSTSQAHLCVYIYYNSIEYQVLYNSYVVLLCIDYFIYQVCIAYECMGNADSRSGNGVYCIPQLNWPPCKLSLVSLWKKKEFKFPCILGKFRKLYMHVSMHDTWRHSKIPVKCRSFAASTDILFHFLHGHCKGTSLVS